MKERWRRLAFLDKTLFVIATALGGAGLVLVLTTRNWQLFPPILLGFILLVHHFFRPAAGEAKGLQESWSRFINSPRRLSITILLVGSLLAINVAIFWPPHPSAWVVVAILALLLVRVIILLASHQR